VLEKPAIKVLPVDLAQGKLGHHYFKGWEERQKHGGSLIGEQIELPVRGMEDQPYGALRPEGPPPAPPVEESADGAAALPLSADEAAP
jgi:ferredoxin-type protein NapG